MSSIQLYHGDWRDVLPTLSIDRANAALITDPPYGMDLDTQYKARGRGALAECNDFEPIVGDNEPFDPTPFLDFKHIVLFGANWYADKLPASGAWLVWDKLDGLQSNREVGFNDNSDCELAWTNKGKAARIIAHRWMGAMKGSEHSEARVHPTQKPVYLMEKILRHYTPPGCLVVDPFMGTGPLAIACIRTGRDFIGIERVQYYYDYTVERVRIEQSQLTFLEAIA